MLGREERIKTLKTLDEKLQYVANRVTKLQPEAELDKNKVKPLLDKPEITVFELLHISSDELQKEISKANNRYRIWTKPVIGEMANSLYSVTNSLYSVCIKVANAFIHKDPGAKILLGSNFFTHEDYFSEAKSLTEGFPSRLELAEEHLDERYPFRFEFLAEEHLLENEEHLLETEKYLERNPNINN